MRPDTIRDLLPLAVLLALALMLSPAPGAGQEPGAESEATPCAVAAGVAGAWAAEGGDQAIRFFRERGELRFALVLDGRLDLVAPVVACGADFVETCSFGRRHRMDLAPDGDRLEVHHHTTDVRRTYRRLDEVPEAFDPRPLEIPEPEPLPAERVAAVREDLAARLVRDQAVRQDPIDGQEMMRVDADNTAYLKDLVLDAGWIDPARFGEEAANAAFLIVQHSGDLPLMLAALPHLREQGRLQEYALLYDRLQIRTGGEQRYGSQIGWAEDGIKGLLPIETLDGIDARREELGLGPLDEYLARFEIEEPRVLTCDQP